MAVGGKPKEITVNIDDWLANKDFRAGLPREEAKGSCRRCHKMMFRQSDLDEPLCDSCSLFYGMHDCSLCKDYVVYERATGHCVPCSLKYEYHVCGNCEQVAQHSKDDYLCVFCRE